MHLKNQPPMFVPFEYVEEVEKLSKAALMDMVWDYAEQRVCHGEGSQEETLEEFRERRNIIVGYRNKHKSN